MQFGRKNSSCQPRFLELHDASLNVVVGYMAGTAEGLKVCRIVVFPVLVSVMNVGFRISAHHAERFTEHLDIFVTGNGAESLLAFGGRSLAVGVD